MGQCYTVNCKLKFDDKESVRRCTAYYMNGIECNWHKSKEEIENLELEELLKIFTYAEEFEYKEFKNGSFEISFGSAFDQSYMWESLLTDWFEAISATLRNGSFFTVYPDNDYSRLVVKNNECIWTH